MVYRFDPAAGLVRYYYYDNTARSFSDASEKAPDRTADGRGYLGVPASDAEKTIYANLVPSGYIHLAISDDGSAGTTEGMWVVTDGPRKGQLFWNHVANPKVYGPGADGSGWSARGRFWTGSDPDGGSAENYARMDSSGRVYDSAEGDRGSVIHEDFELFGRGIFGRGIFARVLEVAESPPNPVLRVDFDGSQATAQRPLILTEHHLSVKDVDTRDPLDDTKVDASKIKFRITNIQNGTLYARISMLDPWVAMTKANVGGAPQDYYSFTLAQLQGKLVAFFPDATGTLTFDIQAADDGPHLSDSDPYDDESDADPTSVSVSVVALETVVAGKEARINEDGGLTPDNDTLDAWLAADNSLRIFVELQKGKSGIVRPSAGVVQEHLSVGTHGVGSDKIAVSWDANDTHWRLSLAGTTSARRADFQEVLGALRLQTVHSAQGSDRTISVQPDMSDMSVSISRAGYYLREVEVSASDPNPVMEVDFSKLQATSQLPLILTEEHISVYDPDTRDTNDLSKVDALRIKFRITNIPDGILKRRIDISSPWENIDKTPTTQYREFTLAQLQGKLVALFPDAAGTLTFDIQAADDGPHLSDSDPYDDESDADPTSVSVSVVALETVVAGKEARINEDGGLTPE